MAPPESPARGHSSHNGAQGPRIASPRRGGGVPDWLRDPCLRPPHWGAPAPARCPPLNPPRATRPELSAPSSGEPTPPTPPRAPAPWLAATTQHLRSPTAIPARRFFLTLSAHHAASHPPPRPPLSHTCCSPTAHSSPLSPLSSSIVPLHRHRPPHVPTFSPPCTPLWVLPR